MIKLENAEVLGWEAAIRGMRNPMNSWDKSDSYYGCDSEECLLDKRTCHWCTCYNPEDAHFHIGSNDKDLMKCLAKSGTDHRKFMRMITVYVDITAPLYWWKEFDTYKVGTVANSCSTMHKIHAKEFEISDFSTEHLVTGPDSPYEFMYAIIIMLNAERDLYLKTKDKKHWWQMIQLLPSSYNQKRTVMLNYEVLANIFAARCNHKLDEWKQLCGWMRELPYSELITGEFEEQ